MIGAIAGLMALLVGIGCGNNYRPVVNPLTPGGGNPSLARFALVVNQDLTSGTCADGTSSPCVGATSEIDVSGDTLVTNVLVGRSPQQAVISSQVVVSNQGDDDLCLYGLTTGTPPASGTLPTIVSLPAGSLPSTMAAANGAVYVADPGTNQVTVVAPASNLILTTLSLPAVPVALAATPDGTQVYVANQDKSVTAILTADNSSQTISGVTTASPVAIVADASSSAVYVLENTTPSISVINVLTDTVVATLTLPSGGNSNSMAFDPRLRRLYVTNPGGNSVSVFDASSPLSPTLLGGSAVTSSSLSQPCAVATVPDGSRAYVVNGGATGKCDGTQAPGQVVVINATSNTVSGAVTVGNGPVAIATSGDGRRVYVPHQGVGTAAGVTVAKGVTVIDATTDQLVIELGAPFTNPACLTDGTTGCVRMNPVFIVSQ